MVDHTPRPNPSLSLEQLQREVDGWVSQYTPAYWQPHQILARIMEEVGELARELNHTYGPKPKKPTEQPGDLTSELGDIVFSLICLANSQHISLDDAFRSAMNKSYDRDKNRFIKKSD